MIEWIFNNAQTLIATMEFVVVAVFGFLFLTGSIGGKAKEIQHESDGIQQTLINNYRTLIDDQTKKLQALNEENIQSGKDIAHLQGQVKTLTEILQGKDPAMQSFLKSAPRLVEIAEENNTLAKHTDESLGKLADAITALVHNLDQGPKPAPQLVID